MASADVVVVGAGVNGASTAFHLTRAGVKRVVICEQRHVGAGATGKSGALVRTHYTNEPETRLAFASHAYFANWREIVDGAPRSVDLRPFRSTRFAEGQPRIDEHAYGPVPGTVSR